MNRRVMDLVVIIVGEDCFHLIHSNLLSDSQLRSLDPRVNQEFLKMNKKKTSMKDNLWIKKKHF